MITDETHGFRPPAAWARAPHLRFVRVAAEEITGHAVPLSSGGA
ncbi:hypothetical protein ACQPZ8_28270 [Actinomadura nitritigenes]